MGVQIPLLPYPGGVRNYERSAHPPSLIPLKRALRGNTDPMLSAGRLSITRDPKVRPWFGARELPNHVTAVEYTRKLGIALEGLDLATRPRSSGWPTLL